MYNILIITSAEQFTQFCSKHANPDIDDSGIHASARNLKPAFYQGLYFTKFVDLSKCDFSRIPYDIKRCVFEKSLNEILNDGQNLTSLSDVWRRFYFNMTPKKLVTHSVFRTAEVYLPGNNLAFYCETNEKFMPYLEPSTQHAWQGDSRQVLAIPLVFAPMLPIAAVPVYLGHMAMYNGHGYMPVNPALSPVNFDFEMPGYFPDPMPAYHHSSSLFYAQPVMRQSGPSAATANTYDEYAAANYNPYDDAIETAPFENLHL